MCTSNHLHKDILDIGGIRINHSSRNRDCIQFIDELKETYYMMLVWKKKYTKNHDTTPIEEFERMQRMMKKLEFKVCFNHPIYTKSQLKCTSVISSYLDSYIESPKFRVKLGYAIQCIELVIIGVCMHKLKIHCYYLSR